MSNQAKGSLGQKAAARFLQSKGYVILQTNYRAESSRQLGEIDLIAQDGSYTVFVEVKYRQSQQYGLPREAVGLRKQQRLRKAALHYIGQLGSEDADFRFDVVELLETQTGLAVSHIENAF